MNDALKSPRQELLEEAQAAIRLRDSGTLTGEEQEDAVKAADEADRKWKFSSRPFFPGDPNAGK